MIDYLAYQQFLVKSSLHGSRTNDFTLIKPFVGFVITENNVQAVINAVNTVLPDPKYNLMTQTCIASFVGSEPSNPYSMQNHPNIEPTSSLWDLNELGLEINIPHDNWGWPAKIVNFSKPESWVDPRILEEALKQISAITGGSVSYEYTDVMTGSKQTVVIP